MPELNQLHQLVTIADSGTISKAAEIVHISQPALTRSMQKLESEWDVTLFDRQKNKVTLNKTGELAVQYARRILDDVDNMTRTVQAFERSLRTISVGSCAPGPLMELYPILTERFPGMTISSEMRNLDILLPELKKNTYQLIITDHPIEEPHILCRKFRIEQLYLTVPPAHPLADRHDGIYLEDLAGETMLLYKDIGIWSNLVETKMSQTKFILQDQDEAFVSLIQASALPAFATNLTLDNGDRRQNRAILPILDPEASITFYCCVHESNREYLPKR